MASKEKKKKIIKKFRIALLGPSYVGKTQIVNRFINNSFIGYYDPTLSCQVFKRAYNINEEDLDMDPQFFDIEIWDMFPHDHPFMDEEPELMGPTAKAMTEKLNQVIKSPFEGTYTDKALIDRIHAYMFVYDSSNKRTFQSMFCMIETIMELEKSKKKGGALKAGKKKAENTQYYPKKIVVGNKKDLKKNKELGVIDKNDIKQLEGIKIKEVSALQDMGIIDAFK